MNDPKEGVVFGGECWSWARIARHILFMGGTGSGKTYTADALIRALMASGCPMMLNAVKVDDYERILKNATRVGMASRVVELTPSGWHRMSLIEELLKPHLSAATAAKLLSTIGDVGHRSNSGGDHAFWVTQGLRCLSAAITLCREVLDHVTISDVHAVVMSSPADIGAARNQEWDAEKEYDANGERIARFRCAELMVAGIRRGLDKTSPAFINALSYLARELPSGGDRMRGGIIANVNNCLGPFLDFPYLESFGSNTTFTVKDIAENGLIAVTNAPILRDMTPARMWQYAWVMEAQRYCLARDASKVELPFILWRDEAGLCLNPERDAEVQLVARSQKLAMVSLIQDVSTLLTALGGESAKHEAYSFLANHGSKFLFSTDDINSTAKWMSALLGDEPQILASGGGGKAPSGDFVAEALGVTCGHGWSESYQARVRPAEFARLQTAQCYLVSEGRYRYLDLFEGRRP